MFSPPRSSACTRTHSWISVHPPMRDSIMILIQRVPFTPEVLQQIEEEMKKVIKENQRFEKIKVSREEAIKIIKEMGQQTYKLGRLDDIPEGEELYPFIETANFSTFVREAMFPTPRKSRLSNYSMSLDPTTAEIQTTSNFSVFTERPSPPRTN